MALGSNPGLDDSTVMVAQATQVGMVLAAASLLDPNMVL